MLCLLSFKGWSSQRDLDQVTWEYSDSGGLASTPTDNIDKFVTENEDHTDTIDDHNNDALLCSDVVISGKEKYQESFPTIARVYLRSRGTLVTVKNDTPHLLHDSNKPLIVTSIRKSDETGGQTFGHEYTVDSGCENTIRIDYTWDVDGSTPIPPCRIINWPLHSHSVTGYLSNYPGKLARCEVLVVSVTEAALHKTLRNNK